MVTTKERLFLSNKLFKSLYPSIPNGKEDNDYKANQRDEEEIRWVEDSP